MPAKGKNSYSIQSVENALDVLEAFCEEGDEVRISRLSERLGMNKTSVFRLLATFESRGYVEREADSGTYRLGLSAYEIGQKFLSRMALLQKAKPVMERLVRECNEAAYLAIQRDEEVLFLEMVDTTQQVKIVSLVGRRYPIAATSAGKVILANTAAHGRKAPKRGADELEELIAIRKEGFYLERGALGEGIVSAAVPLFRAGGETPGSLCFIGPDFRMSPERMEHDLLPRLKEAGEIISSMLGYLGSFGR